jgi:predicted lipoprotein with Yx(FWY)xxD motif
VLAVAVAATSSAASCGEHEGKLVPAGAAGASVGGAPGSLDPGGEGGGGAAPLDDPDVPSSAGAGGGLSDPIGNGGAAPQPGSCIYQLDVEGDAGGAGGGAGGANGEAGEGGEAGQGGESSSPTIAKATSRLLGDYLADASGRALYVFGADSAGDCEAPPVSDCVEDCPLSWPIFHADPRVLAAGIDEAAFGSFTRADGLPQTTYYGWPLYYYANDAKPGDVTGHGSGVWGLAELILPNVIVRRVGADRLLADGAGRTLYSFAEDTLGTPTSPPQSACTGSCLEAHPPFSPRYVGAISTLEPRDLTSFVRGDGTTHVAYKGAPLYYSLLDGRPGAVNGTEDQGFMIVLK